MPASQSLLRLCLRPRRPPPRPALPRPARLLPLLPLALLCPFIPLAHASPLPAPSSPPSSSGLTDAELDALLLGESALTADQLAPLAPPPADAPAAPTPAADAPAALSGFDPATLPPDLAGLLQLPPWFTEIRLTPGFGYADNPLLTTYQRAGSSYTVFEAEALAFQLPAPGRAGRLSAYTYGRFNHFLSGDNLDDEILLLARAGYDRSLPWGFSATSALSGYFSDRLFGLSPLEDTLITTAIRTTQVRADLGLEHRLFAGLRAFLDGSLERNFFADSPDEYWLGEGRLGLRHDSSAAGAFLLSAAFGLRDYDERLARVSSTIPLRDTVLRWEYYRFDLSWDRRWGTPLDLRSSLDLGFRHVADNGVGYDDQDRSSAEASLSASPGPWEFRLEAGWTLYDYLNRTVSRIDPRPYRLTLTNVDLEIVRNLGDRWVVKAVAGWEENLSDRSGESYQARRLEALVSLLF